VRWRRAKRVVNLAEVIRRNNDRPFVAFFLKATKAVFSQPSRDFLDRKIKHAQAGCLRV
jgi:hypothetical protein